MNHARFQQLLDDWTPRDLPAPARYIESFAAQRLESRQVDRFRERLLALLLVGRARGSGPVGSVVRILDREETRTRLAEQWRGLSQKLVAVVEQVVRRHLGQDDAYFLADEDVVILFSRSSRVEAGRIARTIAGEINARLARVGLGIAVGSVTAEFDRLHPEEMHSPHAVAEAIARDGDPARAISRRERGWQIGVSFWPVANLRKRLISMYLLALDVPDSLYREIGWDEGHLGCWIDCLTLAKARDALVSGTFDSSRALLIVPVRYGTLSSRAHREQYLEVCRSLPRLSEKRVVLLVTELDDRVSQPRLHHLFTFLASYFVGFVGCFGPRFRRGDQLGGLNLVGLGVEGPRVPFPGRQPPEHVAGFARHARRSRFRSFFFNARTYESAVAARRAGYDYVQGPGLSKPVTRVGRVPVEAA